MTEEIIVCAVDKDGVGLAVPGLDIDDPYDDVYPSFDSRLLAHDIVEHLNGYDKIGCPYDELEALGAVWFVRGQFADLSRGAILGSFYSPEESIGRDVLRCIEKAIADCGELTMPNSEDRVPREDWVWEDSFFFMMSAANKNRDREYVTDSIFRQCYRPAIEYMQIGWKKAQKKYGCAGIANRLFWNIEEVMKPYMRHFHLEEGQRFRIRYSLEDGEVSVTELEREKEEDYYV